VTAPALLEVRDLRTCVDTELGPAHVVDGVSFDIAAGETLGLVGESGCGKSMTALSILRLVAPAGRITGGSVRFAGRDLVPLPERELRAVRGRDIGLVFQDPVAALNPVLTCGDQLTEVIRAHSDASRGAARARAIDLLRRVQLPDPERQARAYPHELSGGMCQRVVLAIALACGPRLLVADEPTTALDVTVQAQICELLRALQAESGMGLLLISHDLGLVAGMADRIAIMYAGRIVETAPVARLFASPRHPYTRALLRAMPDLDAKHDRLSTLPGTLPHPARVPPHCRFHDRCAHRIERCRHDDPALRDVEPGHAVACHVEIETLEPWNGGPR
jgi:oligopeptide/dipeptide ABC transporter ATP-binding protein